MSGYHLPPLQISYQENHSDLYLARKYYNSSGLIASISILILVRYTTNVAAHGPIVLKLVDGISVDPPSFTYYEGSTATLAGGTDTRVVNATVTVVGHVGHEGSVTFENVDGGSDGGSKLLAIDYINADYVFSGGENYRSAYISVNGEDPTVIEMPISGQVSYHWMRTTCYTIY